MAFLWPLKLPFKSCAHLHNFTKEYLLLSIKTTMNVYCTNVSKYYVYTCYTCMYILYINIEDTFHFKDISHVSTSTTSPVKYCIGV